MPTTTTTELVTFDGLVLNTYAYGISTRGGRYHVPQVRGDRLVLPGRSGYIPTPMPPLDEGEFTLSMFVLGANTDGSVPSTTNLRRQAFENNVAALMRAFTNRATPAHVTAVQADGSTRECWAEVWDAIDFTTMAGGTRAEVAAVCLIPDVYWQDVATNTQATSASSTLPKTLNLTGLSGGAGTIEDSVITTTGPIVTPRVTDNASGSWVQYNGSLASGATWVVDCGAYTSKVGSTDVSTSTTHGGAYRYLVIPSHITGQTYPTVTLSGSNGGAATKFQVAAHRKHFSA